MKDLNKKKIKPQNKPALKIIKKDQKVTERMKEGIHD